MTVRARPICMSTNAHKRNFEIEAIYEFVLLTY